MLGREGYSIASDDHGNRRPYNWLVYRSGDRLLQKYASLYRGVLYDLGCGDAPYRQYFLRYAEQYVGVDWKADRSADLVADLNRLPLPIESEIADTVVSLSVLEHLCEPQSMLNEAYRILKPGGAMIVQVPFQWRVHEAPHDYFRFTPYGLKYLLGRAGFSSISVEPMGGFFTTSILKLNYFSKRLVRGPKPIRWLMQSILLPFWYAGQCLAPYLDKLDRDWTAEASGYFATAVKA